MRDCLPKPPGSPPRHKQAQQNELESDRKKIMLQAGVGARVHQLKQEQARVEEASSVLYVRPGVFSQSNTSVMSAGVGLSAHVLDSELHGVLLSVEVDGLPQPEHSCRERSLSNLFEILVGAIHLCGS